MHYSVETMVLPQEIAKNITEILPRVKRGPLQFWGQSFGRPGENSQCLVACDATDDCLRLRFSGDEVLAVWNPADLKIDETTFRIVSATAIRSTWYYFDRPKTPDNLRYWDYAQHDGRIAFRTNWNTVPGSGWLEPDAASYPAVEMPDSA
jgi:hypothetical protein